MRFHRNKTLAKNMSHSFPLVWLLHSKKSTLTCEEESSWQKVLDQAPAPPTV